jgi:hypothetical protein
MASHITNRDASCEASRAAAWWGLTLTLTYLAQALVSHLIERRYEPDMLRSLYWIIWYR